MEQDENLRLHEEEVMAAFDKLRANIKTSESTSSKQDHTQVVASPSKKEGVIDRAEWDRILSEIDAKAASETSNKESSQEGAWVSVGETAQAPVASRAARHAASEKPAKTAKAAIAAKAIKPAKAKPEKKVRKVKEEKEPRQPKEKGEKKPWSLFKKILVAIIAIGVVACIVVGVLVLKIIKETPDINPNNIYNMLSQSSVIYDINGDVVDNIYSGTALRTNVEYAELPKDLINAFVAVEDKTFFKHHGFNFVRIAGAVWQKVSGQKDRIGGTSTITQQLARNIFLESEKGERKMSRKIREAYYTLIIEDALSKEQILEAYLNTVYLGFNSNGVCAAARAYFNKDLDELNLVECAQLAALPQSPNSYAPLKRISAETATASGSGIDIASLDIVDKNDTWITYYNDTSANRVKLVLKFMYEQEKIDEETYNLAKEDSVRNYVNPGVNIGSSANDSSYCTDFITKQVLNDLQTQLGYSYEEARKLLYEGGLVVNSTLDMTVQKILESAYNNPDTFPKINLKTVNTDAKKNILNAEKKKIVLYAYDNLFDSDNNLMIQTDECKWNADGSLTLLKGMKLNFYNTKSAEGTDVRVDIKDFYEMVDSQLYSRSGSYLLIDSEYKSRNDAGDVIISAAFFDKYPDAITKTKKGGALIAAPYYQLASRIIQPQSAMVIVDNATGQMRGMVGGRGISGKLLFNRATATRQPGSSIKPLALYSTALQVGYDAVKPAEDGTEVERTSNVFTAATPLDNIPMCAEGELWPGNVDLAYHGITSLRKAVEKSVNGCAVNLYNQLNPKRCIENVQNLGITSLVLDAVDTDENPSSLALGGMLKGVSPFEMAGAYATFGNYGLHNDVTCYTTVTNRKGDIILKADSHPVQVLDEEVASLMLDILRTTVEYGGAASAKLNSQPAAGKTGTTSDKFDIWFCGILPKYTGATWVGCDSNINLGADSTKAIKVWKAVMEQVGKLDEKGAFELKGDFVTVNIDSKTGGLPINSEYGSTPAEDIISEIFIAGTEPTENTTDYEARGYVEVCTSTGYLATPYCGSTTWKEYLKRPGGQSWETLLASYDLRVKPEEDENGELPPFDEWEKIEREQFLTLIEDSQNDPPQFYCPIHNSVTYQENAETHEIEAVYEYPVSPFAESGMHPVYDEPYDEPEDLDDAAGF